MGPLIAILAVLAAVLAIVIVHWDKWKEAAGAAIGFYMEMMRLLWTQGKLYFLKLVSLIESIPMFAPVVEGVRGMWRIVSGIFGKIGEWIDRLTGWFRDSTDLMRGAREEGEREIELMGKASQRPEIAAPEVPELDAEGRPVLDAEGQPVFRRRTALEVPELDAGGIVSRPTLAALAMDNQPEAVVPLSLLGRMVGRPVMGDFALLLAGFDRIIQAFRDAFRPLQDSLSPLERWTFADNMRMLMNPAAPLPLPIAPAGALAGGSYTTTNYSAAPADNRTINIAEGAIVIHAAAGQNEKEIGQVAIEQLRDQIQSVPAAFDSKVKR